MAVILAAVDVMDADDYNRIPLLEDHKHDIPPDDLLAIGNILVQYGYQHDLSICSKHRHFKLSPQTLMVYSKRSDGLMKSSIQVLERLSMIFPRTISLDAEDSSSPFEYALEPPNTCPRPEFLHDLTCFLRHRNLQNVIALSLQAPSEVLLEMSLDQEPGLIYTPKPDYKVEEDTDAVVTGWRFEIHDGKVVALPCQACITKGGGRHHDPDADKEDSRQL